MELETEIPSRTIRQTDLPQYASAGLLGEYPVAVRTPREVTAGGFADQTRHPNTWTVYFLVEGEWAQLLSARGLRREWTSLDRLENWLRSMSFRFFWVRNDIDAVSALETDPVDGASFK
ncbi:hypothetical protein [Roseobacter denitrificans]|uniref:Uncharacterized protein n=1 Tax=Roseobacter denitrificans (strain ATCC 33942 / OCh 114) TaxID=375451 RepID=Q16BX1_ROSDO|nr:hypothetical protein [Roseobacter denitrificans]ABG30522.1 hypothetical protein RD1_0849 [Roseobacter denitrificans OCh 114]SFF73756.1 hypothetical protein SAMN05443635_101554 [Roseobacter denitrificans OCh 114]